MENSTPFQIFVSMQNVFAIKFPCRSLILNDCKNVLYLTFPRFKQVARREIVVTFGVEGCNYDSGLASRRSLKVFVIC